VIIGELVMAVELFLMNMLNQMAQLLKHQIECQMNAIPQTGILKARRTYKAAAVTSIGLINYE
jgi:hypothetical protein